MNTLELPAAVRAADQAMTRHTGGEILDHFRQKYPGVELDGREVFLFTSARGFGDRKHIVAFHSSEFATVPEHIYQYVLITYCYSGHFRLVVDTSAVTLGAGDCFVADRHVPHGVVPTGPDDIAINIILNDRFFQRRMMTDIARLHASFATALATPGDSHAGWRVYRTAGDELARTCIERILCEHLDPRAGTPDIIDDFIAALLTHLFRTYESDQERVREDEKYSTLIGDVRGYIEQNYADGNLGRMAAALGYESTYLSSTLRPGTGRTFKQLVNEERVRHAMLLLRSSKMPVYDVAREVGISNLTQFYKRFREYAACTPQEYRDQ